MCDLGGVGWPASLMVVDENFNVIAAELRAAINQGRGTFEAIEVRNGELFLRCE